MSYIFIKFSFFFNYEIRIYNLIHTNLTDKVKRKIIIFFLIKF